MNQSNMIESIPTSQAIESLNARHKNAVRELRSYARVFIVKYGLHKAAFMAAEKLNISCQTVINHLNDKGKCRDGFLTEAITEEYKKLQTINNQN